MKSELSPEAAEAVHLILSLREYPTSQTKHAERKVLGTLSVADYIAAVKALTQDAGVGGK